MVDHRSNEQTPLLQHEQDPERGAGEPQIIDFEKEDASNPRQWPRRSKLVNLAVIALMAILSPLASSMFTPGIQQIADDLDTTPDQVIGATTGFVVMLGVGPLILAPLSETFGRRKLYLTCFTIFSLLQIPTALAPNVETLIAVRTIAGFCGSVGIANGGGTISDMFYPSERSTVFGWYLLGPLLGPTIGPLLGGLITQYLSWRWVFWVLLIVCCVNTLLGFVFLKESYAPVILANKCAEMSRQHNGAPFTFPGEDKRALFAKLRTSMLRPLKILFTQPIVITMAAYQAIIFAIMYSLFTNMQDIFQGRPYHFNTTQVGLLFLAPGLGFLTAVRFIIPYIDTIYNKLTKRNNGVSKPEFRLPLANIGSVLLPSMLFVFAWCVAYRVHWFAVIVPTYFFGIGQVAVFNTVQNYYIDAFEKYAASAIAAGSVMRSLVGGVVPLFVPGLIRSVGQGWAWSTFAFITLLLAPSPILFMRYGESIREKYAITL